MQVRNQRSLDALWPCFLRVTRPDSAVLHLDITAGCCGSSLGAHPVEKCLSCKQEISFWWYQFPNAAYVVAAQVLVLR